jgi:integrase
MVGIGGRCSHPISLPQRYPELTGRDHFATAREGPNMPKAKREPANLTDLKVRSLKPAPEGEYIQGDTQVPGFGVRVRPSGSAAYVVMKRLPGDTKPTRVTLGRVGDVTLQEARERARGAAAAVRQGIDVNLQKRQALDSRRAERATTMRVRSETGYSPGTFGELATRYMKRECTRLARGAEIERLVRRELMPQLGNRRLAELRRRDLNEIANAIVESGRPAAAHKVREIGKRITSWADNEELIDRDPFEGGSNPVRREERARVLSPPEIAALWQAWKTMGAPMGAFMRFALVTGQRRTEIATMERSELDLEGRLWSIPAEKAKNRRAHLVPLSGLAIEILGDVPVFDDRFVFSTRPGTHISGFSKAKVRAARLSGVLDWRLHDLRRTAATQLAELGVAHPVVSKLLNHSPRGVMGVTSIYNRYEYLEERHQAMERWAQRIGEIVEPAPRAW